MNEIELINSYTKTKSLRKTSKFFDISKTKLTKILKRNKVSFNKNKFDLKYKVNSNFFENINDEFSAYWLGFIYADGYVDEKRNILRIELGEKDKNHLEKLLISLDSNHVINYRETKNTYWVSISDKKLITNLKLQGIKQKKSLTCTFPTNLNNEIIKDFIRGYFDGDGSIYTIGKNGAGVGIIGTESFLFNLRKIILENTKVSKMRLRSVNKENKMFRLEIYNKKDTILFSNWLYKNSKIHLTRKYNKYKFINEGSSTTIISPSDKVN